MTQNVGTSRGSQKNKKFVQDSANSYIVDAFIDVSQSAPVSPADGEGYIVENVSSMDPSWGTITGLTDNDIIRYRSSKQEWQIVMKAIVANQGFKAFVKDEDTLYVVDSGAEWIVASGSGGGVKNFAQKQAGAYKTSDWVTGNSGIFGAAGSLNGTFEIETAAPLDGKKSFKYTTGVAPGDDWIYLLVDIDQYARGGVVAFTFDYQWDGDEDIRVHIWDPTFTNEYSTELNLVKNTTNDNKLSRNSRTIYAQPDTESQVVVGFQINSAETSGKTFIWDNLKVTDDIGVIGSGIEEVREEFIAQRVAGFAGASTYLKPYYDNILKDTFSSLATITNDNTSGFVYTALTDHVVNFSAGVPLPNGGSGKTWCIMLDDTSNVNPLSASMYNYKLTTAIESTNGYNTPTTIELELKAGQTLEIRTDYTTTAWVTGEHPYRGHVIISAHKNETTKRFLQVPNGEKLKDNFSARINPNGTIASTSHDFIDSSSIVGTGNYRVNFKPGFFSETPSCLANVNGNSYDADVQYIDTTGCNVLIRLKSNDGLTSNAVGFSLAVQRQGNDVVPDVIGVPVSIQGQTHEQDSMIRVRGANGYGTSNTKVRRFDLTLGSYGDAILYEDSPTEGAKFTIQTKGVYSISYTDEASASTDVMGIVRNGTAGTTNVDGVPDDEVLALEGNTPNYEATANWIGILEAGDVIRPQSRGLGSASNKTSFTITKVGTQPLLDGGVVERPGSNIRVADTLVGRGTTNTHIFTFDTTVENTAVNDINYVRDTVLGDRWEILEDGFYSFSTNIAPGGAVGDTHIGFTKNYVTNTQIYNVPVDNRLIYTARTTGTSNSVITCSWSGRLNKGDVVRCVGRAGDPLQNGPGVYHQANASKVGQAVKYSSRVYKEDPIAWQRKEGTSTATGVGPYTLVQYNNLELGKTYRITGIAIAAGSVASESVIVRFNMTGLPTKELMRNSTTSSGYYSPSGGFSHLFVATDTSFVIEHVNSGTPTNVSAQVDAVLEELPFHAQTTKWT